MTNDFDQQNALYAAQRKAVKNSQIYILLDGQNVVAKLSFHYNASNTGCTCFLWVRGCGISKGIAKGGGYDRRSAAAMKAAQKMAQLDEVYLRIVGYAETRAQILKALDEDSGMTWDRRAEDAGFMVIQAI